MVQQTVKTHFRRRIIKLKRHMKSYEVWVVNTT